MENNILITSVNNKVLLIKQFKQVATNYPNTLVFSGDISEDVSGALFSVCITVYFDDRNLCNLQFLYPKNRILFFI